MRARNVYEMNACNHRRAQPEKLFWRMYATDFWATYACKVWGKSHERIKVTFTHDRTRTKQVRTNRSFGLTTGPRHFQYLIRYWNHRGTVVKAEARSVRLRSCASRNSLIKEKHTVNLVVSDQCLGGSARTTIPWCAVEIAQCTWMYRLPRVLHTRVG